eukprot:s6328_g5.t1
MRKAEGFDAQADRLLDEANCRCVQWWVLVMRSTSCDVAVKSGAQDLREAQARPVVRLTPAFFDAVCQPPLCGKDEMKYRALLQLHPVDLKRVVKGWLPRNGPKAGLPAVKKAVEAFHKLEGDSRDAVLSSLPIYFFHPRRAQARVNPFSPPPRLSPGAR